MILACPACQTRYEVDAANFPPSGRNVRCARCGEVWHAMPEPDDEPFAEPEPAPEPEVRDPEPQVDEQARFVEPEPSGPKPVWWTSRVVLTAGWGALAAVVLVIGCVAALYRQEVVATWPQSAALYSKLGVKVAVPGLKLGNVKYNQAPQNGQLVLTVSGALTNVTNRELPVPQIRVGLVDDNKRELYHWTFAPNVMTLRPGQSTHFVTRLSSPPDGARQLDVRFAKAGE